MKPVYIWLEPHQSPKGDPLWTMPRAYPQFLFNPMESPDDPVAFAWKMVDGIKRFRANCWPANKPFQYALCFNNTPCGPYYMDNLPVCPVVDGVKREPVRGPWCGKSEQIRMYFTRLFAILADQLPAPAAILNDIEGWKDVGQGTFQQDGTGQGQSPYLDPCSSVVQINGQATLDGWRNRPWWTKTLTGQPIPAYSFKTGADGADPNNWGRNRSVNDDARDLGLMPFWLGYLNVQWQGIFEPARRAWKLAQLPGGDWNTNWQGTKRASIYPGGSSKYPVMRGPGGRQSHLNDSICNTAIPVLYGHPPGETYYGRNPGIDADDPRATTEGGWRKDYAIADGTETQCAFRLMRAVAYKFLKQVKATGRFVYPSISLPRVAGESAPILPESETGEYMATLAGMLKDNDSAVDGWDAWFPEVFKSPTAHQWAMELCK